MPREDPDGRPPEPVIPPGPPDLVTIRERHTGGAIYTEVVFFLGEAALAGVIGASVYDGVKVTLRKIAARWRERRQSGAAPGPTREDAEELAHAAIRLRFQFDEYVPFATDELTQRDDLNWSGRIRNLSSGEVYRVRLGPDWELSKVVILISVE
jgi:hypothetical protein